MKKKRGKTIELAERGRNGFRVSTQKSNLFLFDFQWILWAISIRVSVRYHLSICVSFVVSVPFELLFTMLLHFWEFNYWAFSFISLIWLFRFQFLCAFHVAVFLQNQLCVSKKSNLSYVSLNCVSAESIFYYGAAAFLRLWYCYWGFGLTINLSLWGFCIFIFN